MFLAKEFAILRAKTLFIEPKFHLKVDLGGFTQIWGLKVVPPLLKVKLTQTESS